MPPRAISPARTPHPVQVRFAGGRGVKPAQSVAGKDGAHEAHVRVRRRVAGHTGLPAHPADELDPSDRDAGPTSHTSQGPQRRHEAIVAARAVEDGRRYSVVVLLGVMPSVPDVGGSHERELRIDRRGGMSHLHLGRPTLGRSAHRCLSKEASGFGLVPGVCGGADRLPPQYSVVMAAHGANQVTPRSEILLALTAGQTPPLGNIWRITGKKSDFYLDTLGAAGDTMHISLHGPQGNLADHRFHLRVDRRATRDARASGHFIEHMVPSKGEHFRGRKVAENAYQVVRLRWRWHLQRPRFRRAAVSGNAPEIREGQSGRKLDAKLKENSAWDVDVFVAYGEPYWPWELSPRTGDPHMGPVWNGAGLCLTATSVHRAESLYPSPEHLVPRLPSREETPNRLTCGGLGPNGEDDMYWFVETITARELLESWSSREV